MQKTVYWGNGQIQKTPKLGTLQISKGSNKGHCHGKTLLITDHPSTPIPEEPFTFKTRHRCKDYVDRQLWQSVLIKREIPELNVQLSDLQNEGDWVKNTWHII